MFVADTINFREIVMKEPLPLTTIQNAVIDFVRGRDDVVLAGAQAVNVYVADARMSDDVDVFTTCAADFAEELKLHLSRCFHIPIEAREAIPGRSYRLIELREAGNRHLADVRALTVLPQSQRIERVLVLSPIELIAGKVSAYHRRQNRPKSGIDRRDLTLLLLVFPELKRDPGPVTDCLNAAKANQNILAIWQELVEQEIMPETDDDDF
ncbi:MAG: nucleotidyl transferase AbiEii/AbiGii toxin family protein [Acidobacteriota bacterium]